MRSSAPSKLVLLGACLLACQSPSNPTPTKIDRQSEFDRPERPAQSSEKSPDNPLGDPSKDMPDGRDGAQLPKAEIDKLIAQAAEQREIGNVLQERITLGKCANKTPASARCDGELGVSIAEVKNRRAVARYYLTEAANNDDPDAGADLYARVAEAARKHGMVAVAIAAQAKALARDASPENLYAMGRLLSLEPTRLREAADSIAKARETDDQLAWHYEEAVLRGQLPIKEEAEKAIALFESYLKRLDELPEGNPQKAGAEALPARVNELKGLAKTYPTQAEYEKQQAEAAAAAASGASTPAPAPAPTNDPQ